MRRKGRPETQSWLRGNTCLLLGASVWSVVMGASLGVNLMLDQRAIEDLALVEARLSSQALTSISTSLMARQIHDLGRPGDGIRGHITSLNPISPKNQPDDWERSALRMLVAGAAETSEVRDIDGRRYLRLMRSLIIKPDCLQCHAGQGYKVGDMRGGLSVDVPMEPLWDAHRPHVRAMLQLYGVTWLIGLGAVVLATRAFQRRTRERSESEAEFRDLFDNAPVAYHEIDREGVIRRVNRAECVLLGFEVSEMVGRPIWEFVAEADREATREATPRKLSGAQSLAPVQRRYIRRDGGEVFLEIHDSPVRNADGETTGLRSALLDITARKQAEARLMQAQKMESVGRLAGGVAHDFNNQLTVINGYSQFLLDQLSPGDPLRASLEEIRKAGERAERLTQQLLAFSRKQVLQPCVLDVNHLVSRMLSMLRRLVGEDVEVRVGLSEETGTVRADPHQLEQVVMNLVVNARHAMPDGGRLLIETAGVEWDESIAQSRPEARVGRYVMLAVGDDGVGMDEETKKHIFEPFFTTKGVGKGTGLGLSMVQGVVAQSGGYIEVYSEPGHGTTFKIYLPKVEEAVIEAEMPEIIPALGGKETVLVVEDMGEVREYAVEVLKAYGYRVLKAENAGEALVLCQRDEERIDLVLTDVVMPDISGLELASQLGKRQPGIKVLFMSGYTDNVIVHPGVLEEDAHFIQKPFSPEQLAVKIREVLRL